MGLLPRKLGTCNVPICTACAYGKVTQQPWHSKPNSTAKSRLITRPGRVISINQLVLPTPGYIAQLRGTPTCRRYKAGTIFVDHASGAGYVHIQRTTSTEETIEAKRAGGSRHGPTPTGYQYPITMAADNGIFADNKFRKQGGKRQQPNTISLWSQCTLPERMG